MKPDVFPKLTGLGHVRAVDMGHGPGTEGLMAADSEMNMAPRPESRQAARGQASSSPRTTTLPSPPAKDGGDDRQTVHQPDGSDHCPTSPLPAGVFWRETQDEGVLPS